MEGIAFRYINVFLSDSAVEKKGFTQYYVQKPSLIYSTKVTKHPILMCQR